MSKAIVLLSGGQDSTTVLFLALSTAPAYESVHCVSIDYGQRHRRELQAAEEVAQIARKHYRSIKVTHEIIRVPNILVSTSPLTCQAPLEQYSDFETMDRTIGSRIEHTFVPMRNTLFLTLAANRAVCIGAKDIWVGICQEDNANYPDCREKFRVSFEQTVNDSLGMRQYRVLAPLMHRSKAFTCVLAYSIPGCWEAMAHTHTSYDGQYPPTDMNHANVLRAHGFEEADLPDPLVLRAWREGLMELPKARNYRPELIETV
ncbi:MAG: 7-cyano-7-deazaguanine synthase [Bryobacteraceae bacterium]